MRLQINGIHQGSVILNISVYIVGSDQEPDRVNELVDEVRSTSSQELFQGSGYEEQVWVHFHLQ